MEVSYCKCNLRNVKFDSTLRKAAFGTPLHHAVKLAAPTKFHNEEYLMFSCENVIGFDQERVVQGLQDILLDQGRFDLLVLQQVNLFYLLHRECFLGVHFLNQEYFSESAFTNQGFYLEIAKLNKRGIFLIVVVALLINNIGLSHQQLFILLRGLFLIDSAQSKTVYAVK